MVYVTGFLEICKTSETNYLKEPRVKIKQTYHSHTFKAL